jgi:hypothetical protein
MFNSLMRSFADPRHFDADLDPDPNFHSGADPDPTTYFFPDLDPPMLQNDPLKASTFSLSCGSESGACFSLRFGSGFRFPL